MESRTLLGLTFHSDAVKVWHSMPQNSPSQIASLIGMTEPQLQATLVGTGTISEREYTLRIVAAYELDTGATVNQDRCYRCGVLIFAEHDEFPVYLNPKAHLNEAGLCPECCSVTENRLNWEQLMLLKGWRRGLGEIWLHEQMGAIFKDSKSSVFRESMTTPKKGVGKWAS